MAGRYRSFVRRLFIFLNSITSIVFLLACAAPYLDPAKWWFISILGLGFSIMVAVLVLFIFFWLIASPRFVFLSIIPLLIGWKSISVLLAFNPPGKFNYVKPKETLRVATWNVARFRELKRNKNKGSRTRLAMLDLIKQQNADVVCMQEFFHSTDTTLYNNIDYIKQELGYPYYTYAWDGDGYKQWFGQVIFSRYPIVDSGMVHYPRPGQPETLLHADILFNKDTLRVYTTHLQSVQFKKKDFESIEEIKNREDSLLENSRSIFFKLKRALGYRAKQADIVKEITSLSPHPYIITGDFNDVPNSYAYFTIRGNMQDAFLKKGFAIGRTFTGISPTLRIDYLLATKDFNIVQFNRLPKSFSDHYMLVMDVQLKK